MWQFGNRQNGHERIADLRLGWELPGDPITDNYTPDEIDAAALWSQWYKRYVEDDEPRIPESKTSFWHAEPDVRADKGGFIQEHTGWKPSPLQPVVYVPALRDAIRG
jgi:hypothetical protein